MKRFRGVYIIESYRAIVKTIEVEDITDVVEKFLGEINNYLQDYDFTVSTQVEDFIPVQLMSEEVMDQHVRVLQHVKCDECKLILVAL